MQPPSVIFDDVELWFCDYLDAALADRPESYATGVTVSNAVPNPRTSRMVVVRRDGGPRLDMARESARIAVRVWADKEQDAADLARLVRALMWSAPDGNPVCRVSDLAGPSAVPDESEQSLRFMTFEAILRGRNLPPAVASSSSSS